MLKANRHGQMVAKPITYILMAPAAAKVESSLIEGALLYVLTKLIKMI